MKIRIAKHVQDYEIPSYLNRQKIYHVYDYLDLPGVATIMDDDGDEIVIGFKTCAHLEGASDAWEIIKESE